MSRATTALLNAVTDMEEELREVCRAVAEDTCGRLDAAIECGLLRHARSQRETALRAAMVGARTLEMRPAPKGAAVVRIDGGPEFRLSRGDASLLRVLAHGRAREPDGFPVWRTYEELAEELKHATGVRPTRRAIVESVYRVRRELEAAELNPYLLKVDRKTGRLRFFLRLGPQAA